MKLIILLLLFSSMTMAHVKFWDAVSKGETDQFKGATLYISGKIQSLKKHLRARDNFVTFQLTDPKGKNYIEVKLYTISRLKKINDFNCKEGELFTLEGKINIKPKKNKVGKILIRKPNQSLNCLKTKIK